MENKVFRMSGMAITGHARFRDHFSPSDFLRSRELAAGFACQQSMRKLRPRNWYCSTLLFQVVFNWENNRGGRIAEPLDFFRVASVRMGMQPWDVRSLREYLERCRREQSGKKSSGGEAELLGELWEIGQRTGLSEEDGRRLFYLLGAGYLLAEKDLREVPLTAEEARIAYLREEPERVSDHMKEKEDSSEEQSEDSGSWICFPEDGLLRLHARQQPYDLLMGEERQAMAKTAGAPTGNSYGADSVPERKQLLRIRLCRVEALPHRQGSREIPVVLRLYRSVKDEDPQVLSIFPGDYRYFSCLESSRPNCREIHPNNSKPQQVEAATPELRSDNPKPEQVEAAHLEICPYYLHPVRVTGDGCVMERIGDVITVRDAEGKVIREISVPGRNIVSFAPERGGAGWVIAEPDKVDYSNYSMRDIYSPLVNGEIVEVRISRHVLYALRNDGTVYTQFGRGFPEGSGVQSLEQLIQKKDSGNA